MIGIFQPWSGEVLLQLRFQWACEKCGTQDVRVVHTQLRGMFCESGAGCLWSLKVHLIVLRLVVTVAVEFLSSLEDDLSIPAR